MIVKKQLRSSNSVSSLKYRDEYVNIYILNVEKSIKKKLESTNISEIEYKFTGGGITIQLDAVSFEVFLYACEQCYSNSSNYEISKTTDTDKQDNEVQHTHHITHLPHLQSFTLNAYLTICSLIIKGKCANLFID